MDFAVPVDHRLNMKESEKINKYLDLYGALKKLININVTMIRTAVGAFVTVNK